MRKRSRRRAAGVAAPLDPSVVEQRRRDRAEGLEEIDQAKRQLREAARQMAERERKLAEREDDFEDRVRRVSRKLAARRQRQHRLDALRGRFAERELVKGKHERKETQLARGEARLQRQQSDLERQVDAQRSTDAALARRTADLSAREGELDRQAARAPRTRRVRARRLAGGEGR
jgi:hypothetical protein